MVSRRFPFILAVLRLITQYSKNHWWLSILLWVVFITPAQASLILRVAIKNGVSQVQVGSSTKAIVRDGAGQPVGEITPMNSLEARRSGGGVSLGQLKASQIFIEPTGDGYVWIGDRWYRGRTRLVLSNGGLTAVNYVDLEQYLYSVIGSEMDGNWPQEALKAQAVAARSFALYKRQMSRNGIYDVGNTTSWQVYQGLVSESLGTHMAVDATSDQVLTYNGRVILAVFHSSSGGHTENAEDVWSESLPYLRGVEDYDQGTPEYQWVKTFSRSHLSSLLGISNINSLVLERTTPYGRVLAIKVVGSGRSRRMNGGQLRQALGLKSTRFTVTSTPTAFQINGRGYGHGLGMSQWGAYNLALRGANYQQIVLHYYQGTSLDKIQVQ